MASINVEMAVSGAQKCQQQIREVSTQVKAMQSALKLADSEFKLTGDATAMYTSKIQTLQSQIAAQNQAVEAARQGLQHMSEAYGASSSQAMQWQSKLNTAQTGLNNMTASLRDMQAKLAESTSAMSGTAGAADALSGALAGMAGGSYSMDGLNSSLGATQGEIQKTREQLGDLQEQVKETGGLFYNVGNMSISAANGGKVASALTTITKEVTSLVKSSGQTAENTGGLLNGNGGVSVSGVLNTAGGIVSNFGPWGAVAGALLQLGGVVADSITEAAADAEKRAAADRREQAMSTWNNSDYNRELLDRIGSLYSQSREKYTPEVTAEIKAEVTAKVDGLRVIIDEATEDGKVNSREVGSVRKYVQEVLMADYDEAVEDLQRMRGELWKIATQGFTNEEVAMLGVRTGDSEQSALYTFMEQWLTAQGQDAGSWLQEITGRNFDAESLATQMWLHLAKSFGSPEAMTAAMANPETRKQSQDAVAKFLSDEFGMSYEKSQTTAAEFMRSLSQKTAEGFAGTNMTVGNDWFKTTKGGGFFTTWVKNVLGADQKEAEKAASDMWVALMTSCMNPSDAANALWQSSGEEAAAAYQSGEGSDTANAFGAMVAWVKKTLGADETEAIGIAKEMWDNLRKAASYGTTDGTVLTPDTSWIESTEAGTLFTDYVAKLLGDENGGDYADAMAKAKGMWAAVVAACSSPEAAISAVENSTGEEAAAAYQAGEKSEEAQAFGALLAYVEQMLPDADKETAIKTAVGMWDAVRRAVFDGTDDSGVDHRDALKKKYTFTGSTAMREYIETRMGIDFEAAINKANQYWDDLIKAMNGETSGNEGGDLRSSLLQQALADYKGTLEEIEEVTKEMPNLTGSALEAKVAELEALLKRAEELAGRIELLRGADEVVQGQGAYNMVLQGIGSEEDIADAFAYLNMLSDMSQEQYNQDMADAKVARRKAYAAGEDPEKVEAEYQAAVNAAGAKWWENTHTYGAMASELVNAIFENGMMGYKYTGPTQQFTKTLENGETATVPVVPEEVTQIVWDMMEAGMLKGLKPGNVKDLSGPLLDGLLGIMFDMPHTGEHDEQPTFGFAGDQWLIDQGYGTTASLGTTVNGKRYDTLYNTPIYPLMGSLYSLFSNSAGYDLHALRNWFYYPGGNESGVNAGNSRDDMINRHKEGGRVIEIPSDYDTTDAEAEMGEIGANLTNTLGDAIEANAARPIEAAEFVAGSVADRVKSVLMINSPSKLMQQYGAYTAEGLAEGIDAGITRVARASGRMAAAVARPVAAAAATSGPTYNNTATSSLFVENYYQRSDADIDALAASIADKNRLTRMGNGLRT